MPSLVLIGQQIKEKRRGAQCALPPPQAYMIPKYPSPNTVKPRWNGFIKAKIEEVNFSTGFVITYAAKFKI